MGDHEMTNTSEWLRTVVYIEDIVLSVEHWFLTRLHCYVDRRRPSLWWTATILSIYLNMQTNGKINVHHYPMK